MTEPELDLAEFAKMIVDSACEEGGSDLDAAWVQELAVSCGLIVMRKPTPAELADDEWFGHEYGIDADTEGVIERTPAFKQAILAQPK